MFAVLLCLLMATSVQAVFAQDANPFAYADTAAALRDWKPQFGSPPVRVEKTEGGGTCIALDADFKKAGDRACWDWTGKLDLSTAGRISFEVFSTNDAIAGIVGVYFGTAHGWYALYPPGPWTSQWQTKIVRPESSKTEGAPDGWNNVTTFRFSVWSARPGKATFRLRNFRVLPIDPGENYVVNGSFEIDGGGMPYAWGSGHWGIGNLPWAADMDLWRRHWFINHKVTKDGHASLCLENTPDLPLLTANSVWLTPPRKPGGCVLSAWMKADRDNLPVTLSCAGVAARVNVGRDWKQFTLPPITKSERTGIIIAPQAPGTLWIDAVQLQALPQATLEFHPAFGDDALAAREREVDWSPPARTAAVAAGRTVTGPVKAAKVTIDDHGRFFVDGSPYIQHSLGLEFVSDLDILDYAAKSGFKDVCVQIRENLTLDQLQAICDRCAKVGLRIIVWLDGRIPRDRFAADIRALKNQPAVLCWYVYDEPSGDRFAEADARVKLAKELDPAHPAFVNYLSNRLENQTGDIYSTDIYPIPHSTPMAAIGGVTRMEAAAEKEHKPVWIWLQGTGYAYWMDREPTPRELSCMVYGSLIEGACGIYYFAQIPRTKACWQEMRALLVEVDALTPAVSSLEAAPTVECDQKDMLCKAFLDHGTITVLTVNTQAKPCSARFHLSAPTSANADVMFEGRKLAVSGGAWQDSFGPYERHVYRFPAR